MRKLRAIRRSQGAAIWLCCLLSVVCFLLSAGAARADTPTAAVQRLVAALRANDIAAYREALAEAYDYNGAGRADLDPFGRFGVVSVQLHSRIVDLQPRGPDVATALVDLLFLGFFNLEAVGAGTPGAAGTRRLWLELRRQPDGSWRVSALRTVHRRLVTVGWASLENPHLSVVGVNGQPSARLRPGATFTLAGVSSLGNLLLVGIGTVAGEIPLEQKENEPWSVELKAPDRPGRYNVVAVMIAQRTVPGGFTITWDEVTVPLIVE
jgi:hypothetical protein